MSRTTAFVIAGIAVCTQQALANDWPSWRGPEQCGATREKSLVTQWSPSGENLLWHVPIGGRSTPVIMDGRLFTIAPVGSDSALGERVVCLNAETGMTIWEHRLNVFHTDLAESRLGETSVAGDPETGNIYVNGAGGELLCFSRKGEVVWKHSLTEEMGQTVEPLGHLRTPVIDEDRVIISTVFDLSRWITGKRKTANRYMAFDKRTGEMIWSSQPGDLPLNSTRGVPAVTVIRGKRMLIFGETDGHVYGLFARTGGRAWRYQLSKRGIEASVVTQGEYVYVTHCEENIEGESIGAVVCVDAAYLGDITTYGAVWRHDGIAACDSSPALANDRLYVASNGSTLMCFDSKTGALLWEHPIGHAVKGSPVVSADGVIYLGDSSGRFLILRDQGDRCEELSAIELPVRGDAPAAIEGSPAVADGRVYFMSSFATYCVGQKTRSATDTPVPRMAEEASPREQRRAVLQIVPAEVTLSPGERLTFSTRLYDDNGRWIGSPEAHWRVAGAKGSIAESGVFTAAADNSFSAGLIRAKVDTLKARALVRVSPKLPIEESFDEMEIGGQPPGWIGVDGKTKLVEKDGSTVLEKLATGPSIRHARMRAFSGPVIQTGYTVQVDLLGTATPGPAPVLSDMGIINSRYKMILLGKEKRIRLVTYSPAPRLQQEVTFNWRPDVWYRAKLNVDVAQGRGLVRAKVWPRENSEPEEWQISLADSHPNTEGSPGLYAYSKGVTSEAPGAPVFFDNYKVYRNDN